MIHRGVLVLILLAGSLGCGDTTGGSLINIPFRAGGVARDVQAPMTFVTPLGWTVTMQKARIALGPFYFNVSPPPSNAFRGGTVIMQATEQVVVDPLDPAMKEALSGADGETGVAVAVEIGLLAPDAHVSDDDSAFLGTSVGKVVGVASKDGVTVAFQGPIAIDKSLVTPQSPLEALQRVNGATTDLSFTSATQALELRVDATHWFDLVDFSALAAPPSPGGLQTWDAHSTFLHNLVEGVRRQTEVYIFQVQ